MTKYHVELTEAQVRVLIDATEFYTRVAAGQFDVIRTMFRSPPGLKHFDSRSADALLDGAKKVLLDLPPNGSVGIAQMPDKYRTAYDLNRIFSHRLAWDNHPQGNPMHVDFDEPMHIGTEPMASIQTVSGKRRPCPTSCSCLCHDTGGGVHDHPGAPCPGKVRADEGLLRSLGVILSAYQDIEDVVGSVEEGLEREQDSCIGFLQGILSKVESANQKIGQELKKICPE